MTESASPTVVVNLRDGENCEVFVGRPSRWGNPFRIGRDGTREQVIEMFRLWLKLGSDPRAQWILQHLGDLRGKRLGCYCRPAAGFGGRLLCHGQVLAGLADGRHPEEVE